MLEFEGRILLEISVLGTLAVKKKHRLTLSKHFYIL